MFRLKRILFHYFSQPELPVIALVVFWVSGLFAGLYTVSDLPGSVLPLVHSILYRPTSIAGIILVQLFPLFLSLIACRLHRPYLIIPVAFFKAFSFAYCAFGIILAFGDAGWMMRWLFLFSDSIMVVFLLWFWIRSFSENRKFWIIDLIICLSASTFLFVVDYFAILPLSINLVNN